MFVESLQNSTETLAMYNIVNKINFRIFLNHNFMQRVLYLSLVVVASKQAVELWQRFS